MATGVWREEVQHALEHHSTVLGQFINPLPADSYHMTVHPLFTEVSFPVFFGVKHNNDWNDVWMKIMNAVAPQVSLLSNEFSSGPLHAEYVRTVIGNGVTTLTLKLPHEEAVNMSQMRMRIRETIGKAMFNVLMKDARSSADRLAVREWYELNFVGPSLKENADKYRYHLTLGYSRKNAGALSNKEMETLEEEKDMVDGIVRNLICPEGGSCVLTLEKPSFYWFTSIDSMQKMRISANTLGLQTVRMFNMTFPYTFDSSSFGGSFFFWLLCACAVGVVVFIYRKVKHPGSRPGTSLLPLTMGKGSHEA